MLKKIRKFALVTSAVLNAGCITQQISHDTENLAFRYNVYDFSGKAFNIAKKQCAEQHKKPRHIQTDCGFLLCESIFQCVDIKN